MDYYGDKIPAGIVKGALLHIPAPLNSSAFSQPPKNNKPHTAKTWAVCNTGPDSFKRFSFHKIEIIVYVYNIGMCDIKCYMVYMKI